MAKTTTVLIPSRGGEATPFVGIDQRNIQSGAEPASWYDAVNVDLDTGGGVRRRDALLEYAQLPPNTLGLYALGGTLRVAVPAGHGYQNALPSTIHGDVFGDSSMNPQDVTKYDRVSSVSSWGSDTAEGALPYLVLKTASGQYSHHWILTTPPTPTTPVLTRVDLGFNPGADVVKTNGKIYAPDVARGVVRFCSTEFGPGTWRESDAPDDAGNLRVIEHALSDPIIKGLSLHQGRLLVGFANSMQFWLTSPDPTGIRFDAALNGPGTNFFASLSPVIGDVFYYSEGGFRSLATQTVTGELRQGDVGAKIFALTQPFANTDPQNVKSIWSQARSQYICFFNSEDSSDVFCFTLSPTMGITGWSRWELPIAVDYVAELDGVLYVRNGDMVYQFDALAQDDYIDGEPTEIDSYFDSQFVDGDAPRNQKYWASLDVLTDSILDIDVYVDQKNRELTEVVARNVDGTTYDEGIIPIDLTAHAIAVRVRFKAPGQLERLHLDASILMGTG